MNFFKWTNKDNIFKSSNTIIINGKTYSGNTVSMKDSKIYIDGTEQYKDEKVINITVNGNVDELNLNPCSNVVINGNVLGNVETISGNIECRDIYKNAETVSGNIKVEGNVLGSVSSVSGDIVGFS